jgi:hypothetical protein
VNVLGNSIIFNIKDTSALPVSLSGECLLSFIDSDSKIECLLGTNYSIECSPKKKINDKYDSPAMIEFSTNALIGNRYYLQGTRNLSPKETIRINVLDWNLDGAFNDADMVQIDYGGDHFFLLNKKFTIGSGKNQKAYIMNLKPESDDGNKYLLSINKAQ